jgi:hypothetical protein
MLHEKTGFGFCRKEAFMPQIQGLVSQETPGRSPAAGWKPDPTKSAETDISR